MFGRNKPRDSLRLEIDISQYNNLKTEILEMQTRTTVLIADANAATDKLRAVNRELNITLDKIITAKRK